MSQDISTIWSRAKCSNPLSLSWPQKRLRRTRKPDTWREPKRNRLTLSEGEGSSWKPIESLPETLPENKQLSVIDRLEEAARVGSEVCFLKALEEVNWEEQSALDFVHFIKLAFRAGAFMAARQIAAKASKYHPNNDDVQKYIRVLTPERRQAVAVQPRVNTQANRNWLEEHAGEYRGQWVALRNGELLGVSPSLNALTTEVGKKYEVTFPSKEIMLTTGY